MQANVERITLTGFARMMAKIVTVAMAANTSTKEKTSHHVRNAAITTRANGSTDRRRHGRMSFWSIIRMQKSVKIYSRFALPKLILIIKYVRHIQSVQIVEETTGFRRWNDDKM